MLLDFSCCSVWVLTVMSQLNPKRLLGKYVGVHGVIK